MDRRRALHAAKGGLELLGRAALAGYGLWARLRGSRPPLPLPADEIRRILVIRLDLMGDIVFSLPAIGALQAAFPLARVDVLVLPYTAPIVAVLPGVGMVHSLDVNAYRRPRGLRHLPRLASTVAQLRRQRYDVALGLSGVTGGLFAALSGARWRVGYGDEAFWGCYNLAVPGRRYVGSRHEVEVCLDLVRALGVEAPMRYPALQAAFPVVAPGEGPYVVLVPGASNGNAKRWPPEYWAALGDRLARDRGMGVVLSGSGSERALAAAVAGTMREPPVNLAGETAVEELMALLSGAAVVVAGDTGPLHLASALGRPVLGIFGPTDPTNTGPLGASARALRLGLACSPCYDLRGPAECKLPDRSVACMWGVLPDRVYVEVCQLLDEAEGMRQKA